MFSKLIMDLQTLELLGLKEKDVAVYTTVLQLGSAPLRRIAEEAKLNRGTTYDALNHLREVGLVSYVDAKRHRYFTAEDPQKLRGLATRREVALAEARQNIEAVVPQLRALAHESSHHPAVRYYEGVGGMRDILEDVLYTSERLEEKLYRAYSSSSIRDLIAAAWPRYNTTRKNRSVHVRAISMGPGGTTHGMDERRWLNKTASAPTYIFIYGKKTAYVATDEQQHLFGVIIDDASIATTQQMIFDTLWENLLT